MHKGSSVEGRGAGDEAKSVLELIGIGADGAPFSDTAKRARIEVRRESRERMGEQERQRRAADRRRRLGPLKAALQRARAEGSAGAWALAMSEMAQVALDSDHPEREAAHLLLAAQVDPLALAQGSAAALVAPIASERELMGEAKAPSFGGEGQKALALARIWGQAERQARAERAA